MALSASEEWRAGFVVDVATGAWMVTTDKTGASWQEGFLRDPDGRLVVVGS
jgi:hypothetical protein